MLQLVGTFPARPMSLASSQPHLQRSLAGLSLGTQTKPCPLPKHPFFPFFVLLFPLFVPLFPSLCLSLTLLCRSLFSSAWGPQPGSPKLGLELGLQPWEQP